MRRSRWWAQTSRVRGALVLLAVFGAATAATAAAVPYQISRSDRAIVNDSVGGASSLDRDITLIAPSTDQYSNDFLKSVAAQSRAAMAPQLSALFSATDISVVSSGEYPIMEPDGPFKGPNNQFVHLREAAVLGYENHVRFVEGAAPSAPSHVTFTNGNPPSALVTESAAISKAAADSLGLRVGSVVSTVGGFAGDGHEVIRYTITGIYVSENPSDDAFWRYANYAQGLGLGSICGSDVPDIGYVPDPKCGQPPAIWRVDLLVSSVADVDAVGVIPGTGQNNTEIEYVADPSRVQVSGLAALQDAVHRLVVGGSGLSLRDPDGHAFPLAAKTRLDVLAGRALTVERQARVLDYVVLGAASAGALAAFFLMLRTVVTRRSAEIVLCKARGAGPARLASRFAAQSGIVVAGSSVAGVLIATVAGVAAGGSFRAWIGAVLLTLAGSVAVHLRVLAHDDRPGSARREPSQADATARIPRLVRDIAVPLGAAAAVGIMRTRGARNGSGSFDWLAVAAPALLAFAAAVVVVRAVPVLWSVPLWLARRRRGTLTFVATALAGRRVPVLAAPLAGLVVATAAATFAARLDSSVTQGVRDDALSAVGAGARVEAVPDPSTIVLNSGAQVSLPDGFAARAAALPGAGQAMSAFVGPAGISGVPAAPANVAVLVADSGALRALTDRAARESRGRSGRVPTYWPMTPSRPGTVTALVSPGLAGLVGTHATVALPTEDVEVDFVATADLPTASVIGGEYGPGYVVLPSDQMGAKAVKPNALWVTGHPDIHALRTLPGVRPYFPLASYAQVSAAGYANGRTAAAHAVLRMAELLSAGFGLLCLVQTMAGTRSAARDSALLLRIYGLSETGGRLLGPAVTLPLLVLAAAGGLAMGTALAPLLGAQVPGAPSGGWLVPVIGAAVLCTVGGTALEAASRRRERVSVRLRAAEFE
ncbi:hypothetical protein [Catenulispora pinisilvae]|uniref:hypothetical protein n=1 Tax=Catenulispora pinisilvae TaxID=2705253 RepID=UPI001892213B|nr:hypothetical protein [Catenulispora pinisilvae]